MSFLSAFTRGATAQVVSPPRPDPLMTLMLSQPQIDVDSPVVPLAEFDPPVVKPGEAATYCVKLNALDASIDWPEKVVATNLSLQTGGHGQILVLAGGKLQPHTTFNYHARAARTGQYTMPGFTVMVYGKPVAIPAAQLEVTTNPSASSGPVQAISMEVPSTNLYVGQPTPVRVLLPGSPGGMIQGLAQVQINGQGFIVDQSSVRQQLSVQPRPGSGIAVPTFIYEVILTPIASGKLTAFAQGFAVGNRFTGGIIIAGGPGPGGSSDYALLDSDPIELDVKPLPHDGPMPGFTGAFGPLNLDPPVLTTNLVRVGEPLKLTIRVHGESYLGRLVPPPAPHVHDWQIFAASPELALPPPFQARQSTATFVYTLIPLNKDTRETPSIPFRCFDPERGVFQDLTIPPVPIVVEPGSLPANLAVLDKANTAEANAENEPVLSAAASSPGLDAGSLVPIQHQFWFPLAQLVPAAAFLGLIGWDRRRRYLEQHPDIVRRRRALRSLRQQRRLLQRAEHQRNTRLFAASAVNALRVACAPYYPAEPRALVGRDVLLLFPEDDRAVTVVRRFFAVTDAAEFSPQQPDAAELFALKPELDRVLDELEKRLESGNMEGEVQNGKSAVAAVG